MAASTPACAVSRALLAWYSSWVRTPAFSALSNAASAADWVVSTIWRASYSLLVRAPER